MAHGHARNMKFPDQFAFGRKFLTGF